MNIAIIPARGGSKRIPKKNVKIFHGLPIIVYAIQAARKSGIFDEVFVSTDDEEIADIAKNYGASVPWMRPKDLSDDFTTTVKVMQHAVEKLDHSLDQLQYVCCVYPATPLLKSIYLSKGLELLREGDWDYVVSVAASRTPPERLLSLGKNKEIEMCFPENEDKRSQDFPTRYQDAGQFYWGKKASWKSALPIFTSNSSILELPSKYTIDIDTLEDWQYTEHLFSVYGKDSS